MSSSPPKSAQVTSIRDAAALIVLNPANGGSVLMGRRPMSFKFMPGVYVFPGGALDREDRQIPVKRGLAPSASSLIGLHTDSETARSLAVASIRETLEETGFRFDHLGGQTPDSDDFQKSPLDLSRLEYFARALTPPWHPRRFHARFFIGEVEGDIEVADTSDELEDIRWIPLEAVASLKIAPVTEFLVEQLKARLKSPVVSRCRAPYFHWHGEQRVVHWDCLDVD